jgi:hypothetical protein
MTSIEKVFELLEKKGDMRETTSIRNLQLNIDTSDYLELKRQAKEMHKQEILDAWEMGRFNIDDVGLGEEYYQETFVSKVSGMSEKPNNHIEPQLPQQEMSDEEIEKGAKEYYQSPFGNMDREIGFRYAIKWYREQLKQL